MVIRALMRGMQGGQSWRSDVSKESKKKEGALKIEEEATSLEPGALPTREKAKEQLLP